MLLRHVIINDTGAASDTAIVLEKDRERGDKDLKHTLRRGAYRIAQGNKQGFPIKGSINAPPAHNACGRTCKHPTMLWSVHDTESVASTDMHHRTHPHVGPPPPTHIVLGLRIP